MHFVAVHGMYLTLCYSVNRLLLWCCYNFMCTIAKIKIGWSDAYFLRLV